MSTGFDMGAAGMLRTSSRPYHAITGTTGILSSVSERCR